MLENEIIKLKVLFFSNIYLFYWLSREVNLKITLR